MGMDYEQFRNWDIMFPFLYQKVSTYHSIQQVKGSESYGFIFVIKALKHKVFMCLNRFWVRLQDFGHG